MNAPLVSAILAAGGSGRRFGGDQPKQFVDLGGRSMLERSLAAFAEHPRIAEVVVALPEGHLDPPPPCLRAIWPCPVRAVTGGARRQDSVANAFAALAPGAEIVLVHDAARPFVTASLIDRMIAAAAESGAAIPALPARDTVKLGAIREEQLWVASTLPREAIFLAQTPQAFSREVLARAIAASTAGDRVVTDESGMAEVAGDPVRIVEGDAANVKITTADDLRADAPANAPLPCRIGTGYDLHRLAAGRPLILAGVRVPFELGLDGHSDADIVCHAVTDAVLGAAGAGDIGRLFPDTDAAWKDADSVDLLRRAVSRVHEAGYVVGNVDVTVIAQRPRLAPHVTAMQRALAAALFVDPSAVSVKAKTNEGLDSMGRGESMACHAVALLARSGGPVVRPEGR